MKYTKCLLTLCVLAAFLSGCAMTTMQGGTIKTYSEMTPKEKVGYAKKIYNNAAGEYLWQFEMRRGEDGKLSDEDLKFLRPFYQTLEKGHKAILIYEAVTVTLTNKDYTSIEAEDMMVEAIRELTIILGGE